MKAVVFLGDRQLELQEFSDPTPGPGEVVIEIKASGMCGSDLTAYRAKDISALGLGGDGSRVIAGHEPSGVIVAVGPGVEHEEARIGQRVMDHHYKGCGCCKYCTDGWSQLCQEGIIVYGVTGHGAHAPYMKVPASTIVPLPEALSFETGAAISCGTGTAYAALRRMKLSREDTIAIFGQGPVGLSATQLASAMGATVIAVDFSNERRGLAESFGARHTIDPIEVDTIEGIRELTKGEGCSLALDCTGSPEARIAAVRATRIWGTVCFVGEGNDVTLEVSPDLLRKQLTIIGSWTFSKAGQAECARFVAENGIQVDKLFTHRFKLEQAGDAYRIFDKQKMGKGVFVL
jgi:2-desacetyl-2-hydroxyethyl bacteriochlorophyllide A dehydrogenase